MHDPSENPGRSRDARNKNSADQRFVKSDEMRVTAL